MTLYPGDFEEHTRDLLSNIYDYLSLVNNPVAQKLGAGLASPDRAAEVRQMVFAAIDALGQEADAPRPSRQDRLYQILRLRYIEQQPTTETLNRLALSERQYYREHQRAIQTISQILWDQHFARDPAPASPLIEELDHLQRATSSERFDPRAELQAAIAATRVMAQEQRLCISLQAADRPRTLTLSQPLFRQLVILLLSKLIPLTANDGQIALEWRLEGALPSLAFRVTGATADWEASLAELRADKVLAELTKRLNANMRARVDEGGRARLALRFDQARQSILVVDDNPDSISLFDRYLAKEPYQLLFANTASDALRMARESPPLCIILDVMLPDKDGWQILQTYKSHPATAAIPVLICSVLDMRDLALSLGADGYIQKPPSRDEFLALLRRLAD